MICTRRGRAAREQEGPGEAGQGLLLAREKKSRTSPGPPATGLWPWRRWGHLITPPLPTSSLKMFGGTQYKPVSVRHVDPTIKKFTPAMPLWAASTRQNPEVRDRCFGDTQDWLHTLLCGSQHTNLRNLSKHQSPHLSSN